MEPLGLLRADAIFADLLIDLDMDCATPEKKGHYMAYSAVSNKTVNPTADSNALCKNWYQSECLNTQSRQSEARRCTSAYAWSFAVLLGRGGSEYGQRGFLYEIA